MLSKSTIQDSSKSQNTICATSRPHQTCENTGLRCGELALQDMKGTYFRKLSIVDNSHIQVEEVAQVADRIILMIPYIIVSSSCK